MLISLKWLSFYLFSAFFIQGIFENINLKVFYMVICHISLYIYCLSNLELDYKKRNNKEDQNENLDR